MAKRTAIRLCDIKAAHQAEKIFGRQVWAITRGDSIIQFEPPLDSANDAEDRELVSLEALYGSG
jgi:hypothetical protein